MKLINVFAYLVAVFSPIAFAWLAPSLVAPTNHGVLVDAAVLFGIWCLLAWLISICVFGNAWIIDLYWTHVPLLLTHYFFLRAPPSFKFSHDFLLYLCILGMWSSRLTFNYLRREGFGALGERGDWRFEQWRDRYFSPTTWLLAQLPIVFFIQIPMLMAISLPSYAFIHTKTPSQQSLIVDATLAGVAFCCLCLAEAADSTLFAFVQRNNARAELQQPPIRLLEEGLWKYSRHPNYFGEAMFWLVVAVWSRSWLAVVGAAVELAVLLGTIPLTEQRMLDDHNRRALYKAYQQRVSVLVPWFPAKLDSSSSASVPASSSSSLKNTKRHKSPPPQSSAAVAAMRYSLRSANSSPLTPKIASLEAGERPSSTRRRSSSPSPSPLKSPTLRRRRPKKAKTAASTTSTPDWLKWE